nr:PREDICTED: uncharacterized protein LOC109043495 [Bemisia tabaci]
MILNILNLSLVLGLIAVLISASDPGTSDETSATKPSERARRKSPKVQGLNTAVIETYLNALENFDIQSRDSFHDSCQTLTSSIKAVADCVQPKRSAQLTAPLFTFINMRRSIFPDIQYRVKHRDRPGSWRGRIDVMAQRKDGLLFAFRLWDLEEAVKVLKKFEVKKAQDGWTYFKSFKWPVTHWVLATIDFKHRKGRVIRVNASYLLDTYDTSKAVDIVIE